MSTVEGGGGRGGRGSGWGGLKEVHIYQQKQSNPFIPPWRRGKLYLNIPVLETHINIIGLVQRDFFQDRRIYIFSLYTKKAKNIIII